LLSLRSSLRASFVAIAILFTIRMIRLRARQALDETSEWSRYANHPASRGRALGSLMFLQVFPLWSMTRILQLCGRSALAQKLRTRTGNVFADGLLRLG
jgi:hypothetical protein